MSNSGSSKIKSISSKLMGPVLGVVVLVTAAAVAFLLIATKEEPTRIAFPETAPIVDLAPLSKQAHVVEVVGFGNVRPVQEVSLRPQISGMIIETSDSLKPGGHVSAGEILVRVDPRDYQFSLQGQQARLAQAQASLNLELGQQSIAQSEWAAISSRLDPSTTNESLALREPQLQQARADLTQARSNLETARLNLERTSLKAPFNAVVLAETVDIGDVVSVGQETAVLAGTNEFWVEVQISQDDANRLSRALSSADGGFQPAKIVIDERTGQERPGRLISLLSNLAEGSRLATAIVQIDDPLLLSADTPQDLPPVFIGAYVEVHIAAGEIPESYAVPLSAMHENNTVWIRDGDGLLAFRSVEPVLVQKDTIYVDGEFAAGEELVLTRVARAVPGMRIITADEAQAQRRARAQGGRPGGQSSPGGGPSDPGVRPDGPPGDANAGTGPPGQRPGGPLGGRPGGFQGRPGGPPGERPGGFERRPGEPTGGPQGDAQQSPSAPSE
jgi:RND family efflux transporter MFP subunit